MQITITNVSSFFSSLLVKPDASAKLLESNLLPENILCSFTSMLFVAEFPDAYSIFNLLFYSSSSRWKNSGSLVHFQSYIISIKKHFFWKIFFFFKCIYVFHLYILSVYFICFYRYIFISTFVCVVWYLHSSH